MEYKKFSDLPSVSAVSSGVYLPAVDPTENLPADRNKRIRVADFFDTYQGFTQSGAGAVSRSLTSKLRDVISVKDFGAVGDAVADDTIAIQNALDYAGSLPTGGSVYIPAGYYKLTASLLINSRVRVSGASTKSTQLIRYSDYGSTLVISNESGAVVSDLEIRNDGTMLSGAHVDVTASGYLTFERLSLVDGFDTIRLKGCYRSEFRQIFIQLNADIAGRNAAFITHDPVSLVPSYDLFFDTCNFWLGELLGTFPSYSIATRADYGFNVEQVDGLWISNTHIACSRQANFKFGNSSSLQISNIYITNTMSDHNNLHGIYFQGTSGIDAFRFEGRISSISLGSDPGKAVFINSPCTDVNFQCSVEGFKGDGIFIDHANATDITLTSVQIKNIDTDNNGGSGIKLVNGSRISVVGGTITGSSNIDFGIQTQSGATKVVITGLISSGCTSSDLRFENNSSDVLVSSCSLNSSTKVSAGTGLVNVIVDGSPTYTPLTATTTWNPGSIGNGSGVFTTVSVPGAELGDTVSLSAASDLVGLILSGYVSAPGTVTIILSNVTGVLATGPNTTYRVKVIKKQP